MKNNIAIITLNRKETIDKMIMETQKADNAYRNLELTQYHLGRLSILKEILEEKWNKKRYTRKNLMFVVIMR